MMLLRARDSNIQSFAYTWLHKGNQNEFLKHPKIKLLDGGLLNKKIINKKINGKNKWLDGRINFRMLKEFVLISFMKPGVRKTLNT